MSNPLSLRSATSAERSAGCSYARDEIPGNRLRSRLGYVLAAAWALRHWGLPLFDCVWFSLEDAAEGRLDARAYAGDRTNARTRSYKREHIHAASELLLAAARQTAQADGPGWICAR